MGDLVMICDNCGANFHSGFYSQRFCEIACGRAYRSRQSNRGRMLVEHAMLWRLSRDGHYLTEISRMVDIWLKQDEERLGSAKQARRVYEARARRNSGHVTLLDR